MHELTILRKSESDGVLETFAERHQDQTGESTNTDWLSLSTPSLKGHAAVLAFRPYSKIMCQYLVSWTSLTGNYHTVAVPPHNLPRLIAPMTHTTASYERLQPSSVSQSERSANVLAFRRRDSRTTLHRKRYRALAHSVGR